MSAPNLTAVREAVIETLTVTPVNVFEHYTPPDVDVTKPWVVVHWPTGGSRDGPATNPSGYWSLAVRVTAAAQSQSGSAIIEPAVIEAAQWAADVARSAILNVGVPIVATDGIQVVARELQAQGGIIVDGPIVNLPDDYLLTVH